MGTDVCTRRRTQAHDSLVFAILRTAESLKTVRWIPWCFDLFDRSTLEFAGEFFSLTMDGDKDDISGT